MAQHNTQHEQKGVVLEILREKRAGKYANMASVTIGQNEVVIDFAFLLPGEETPTAEVVQRVILSPQVAKNFLSAFQNAVLDYDNQVAKNKTA